jgi:hypothetical protein
MLVKLSAKLTVYSAGSTPSAFALILSSMRPKYINS